MPDPADVIADRIEAALARIEAAKAATEARLAALETAVSESVAELDRLLVPAGAD
ncbi:hypothetical protein KX816_11195 [Sphingosinicellaceae bacterium]|nr:hypothetical protein KX816_11195 [Sphingosinicellaceae bacterium]